MDTWNPLDINSSIAFRDIWNIDLSKDILVFVIEEGFQVCSSFNIIKGYQSIFFSFFYALWVKYLSNFRLLTQWSSATS